jgi:hypothetical protein
MKRIAAIAVAVASLSVASAETFGARAQRAKALEDTPDGAAYQDEMWPLVRPFIASLMERCVPDKQVGDLRSFVWVATLTADGKLIDVEFQPITEVSRCFSRGMEHAPFPKPPKSFTVSGLPLTFNMRLHQL